MKKNANVISAITILMVGILLTDCTSSGTPLPPTNIPTVIVTTTPMFEQMPIEDLAKVESDILQKIEGGETVELLVEYEVKDILKNAEDTRIAKNLRYDDINIRAMKSNAYQKLSLNIFTPIKEKGITITHSYQNIPYAIVRVENPEVLAYLMSNENVRALNIPPRFITTIEKNLTLIGQDIAQSQGFIGTGTSIAIIDTGVKLDEPRLGGCGQSNNSGCCCITSDIEVAALEQSGFNDNFCEPGMANSHMPPDFNPNHGTYVASVASAVAPGANIISLDVASLNGFFVEECGIDSSLILTAFDWILSHYEEYNITAVNMSFEKDITFTIANCPQYYDAALEELVSVGIMPIASSGNDWKTNEMGYPACSPYVLSVGSVDTSSDTIADYSNSSATLDLLAPGTAFGFGVKGTSIASPHVAGAWAVLRAAHPELGLEQTLELLTSTGPRIKDANNQLDFPRLQLDKALNLGTRLAGSSEIGDGFATAITTGDFNGDGFEDAAIGIPNKTIGKTKSAGAVQLIYGSEAGLQAVGNRLLFLGSPGSLVNASYHPLYGGMFGYSLAAGDFNRDHYTDLAISAPESLVGYDPRAGEVYILYGSKNGLGSDEQHVMQRFDQNVLPQNLWLPEYPDTDDNFGFSLSIGDFNDDGFSDLAIGIPNENGDGKADDTYPPNYQSGAVSVVYGSRAGLNESSDYGFQTWRQTNISYSGNSLVDDSENGDHFGFSLASGDFNNDGNEDLAVGVTGEDGSKGAVNIIYGSENGLQTGNNEMLENPSSQSDNFGYSLAAGDFNNDRADDLAIGVPYISRFSLSGLFREIKNIGIVYIVNGSEYSWINGLDFDSIYYLSRGQSLAGNATLSGVITSNDHLGKSLAAGDFDRDGFDDLAIGIPGENSQSGTVQVVYGNLTALGIPYGRESNWYQMTEHQPGLSVGESSEEGDFFGESLASGDFDNDGFMDLLIGVPGEDLPTSPSQFRPGCQTSDIIDTGILHAIYGTSYGLKVIVRYKKPLEIGTLGPFAPDPTIPLPTPFHATEDMSWDLLHHPKPQNKWSSQIWCPGN